MLCVESMFHEYSYEPLGHIQVYCDTYFITYFQIKKPHDVSFIHENSVKKRILPKMLFFCEVWILKKESKLMKMHDFLFWNFSKIINIFFILIIMIVGE